MARKRRFWQAFAHLLENPANMTDENGF